MSRTRIERHAGLLWPSINYRRKFAIPSRISRRVLLTELRFARTMVQSPIPPLVPLSNKLPSRNTQHLHRSTTGRMHQVNPATLIKKTDLHVRIGYTISVWHDGEGLLESRFQLLHARILCGGVQITIRSDRNDLKKRASDLRGRERGGFKARIDEPVSLETMRCIETCILEHSGHRGHSVEGNTKGGAELGHSELSLSSQSQSDIAEEIRKGGERSTTNISTRHQSRSTDMFSFCYGSVDGDNVSRKFGSEVLISSLTRTKALDLVEYISGDLEVIGSTRLGLYECVNIHIIDSNTDYRRVKYRQLHSFESLHIKSFFQQQM
ncbi:predicted protein [Sclerotinia sclerotiorum 1980 UF-70]|uniref:Uncharacterized protein n=1 Tax=Sclerotinia sclerotiorum (strain ATCC 18683 / 1980 / Ss-1) TaxID=665079 RepID=A7EYE5_SCLS1|nr:predicted protein [Sclerotinia sclerotiorum 1980 UF-70]EDN94487.1 predicted protein [Sclerotinia sclerotiorum 1980 UF-70]